MTMKETTSDDIAIIGINGRFPGAANVDEFWSNLVAGVESISHFSDEELAASGLDVAAIRKDPTLVPARGILKDPELFDAGFFGMNAKQAEITDPQQRVFLEAAWEALENAGYDPARVEGPIGVYAGSAESTYSLNNLRSRPDVIDLVGDRVISLGNEKDYLATWVAYKLNLKGPAISVNTACSTSLVAVCQACQSLSSYQCDMALAGGVWISFPQRRAVQFQEGGIFSPDGHCRTFDAGAQGTVSSEGLAIVVLKRLDEAMADGDHIYAVIKGCGLNNDGDAKVGFTAPSVEGQAEAIATALAEADFEPDTVSYIECHGTATPIGDPIEIAALTEAYRMGTDEKNFCALGAVKSNIGHTGSAAGATGLIKTTLALKNRLLPPTLHFTRHNPKIDFEDSPFFVNATLRPWEDVPLPRRAGVSSFGLGGTNAHVVLEEAPEPTPSSPSRPWQLLVLSAKSPAALEGNTDRLIEFFKANPDLNLADAAFTLQQGRQVFEHRQIVAVSDIDDAIRTLEARDAKRIFKHHTDADPPSVVFMFTGQGAQYVNMGADLYSSEVIFKEQIDKCSKLLLPGLGLDLRDVLYPSPDKAKETEELLTQTRITQPALFAFEYALATLWMSWGVKPSALIGHSIGEYVAACLSGVFSLEDALSLVVQRGKLMQSMPHGIMLAVSLPEEDLLKILPTTLSLATLNGPTQCVVSGPAAEIEAFAAALTEMRHASTVLHTSHAFHSAMMDPILQPFADCVSRVKRGQPKIPFISNLTGTWITPRDAADPQYWARHLRNAVRFADGVKELLKSGDSILLEVGPGTTLTSLARVQQQPGRVILPSSRHVREQRNDAAALLTALGQLWLHGVQVDWAGFYAQETRRRIPLPTYAFQRQKYWIEPGRQQQIAASATAVIRREDPTDWFYLPEWKRSELPIAAGESIAQGKDFEWLLFLDACGVGESLAAELAAGQQSVTRVIIGQDFARIDGSTYAINPAHPADYDALIAALGAQGKLPHKIVHLWSVSRSRPAEAESQLDRAQTLGLHSLLFLTRALGEKNIITPIEIEVVTSNVHSVTGEETVKPERATILGAVKVIPLEYPNFTCRNIDIIIPEPGTNHAQRLASQLVNEFSAKAAQPAVAYRSGYRWVETFERVHLDPPAGPAIRLKTNGVYLITGGIGGIGLALAEYLAAGVQAKLILIGRTALPAKSDWANWLATHSDEDETSIRIRHVEDLEKAGAEVMLVSADVSDRHRMAEVVAEATTRFGRIDGVIHSAGSADRGGVIQRRTKESTDEILAAKVDGTLVLDELLSHAGLEFFVLCSSRGTADLGGAFGQVAYVAANEFLDAFSAHKRATGGAYTLTINWDAWREVGMASNAAKEQQRAGKAARIFTDANSLSPSEGAEAFNRLLNYSFARVVVSVADLDARRKSLNSNLTSASAAQPAQHTESGRHARPEVGIAYSAPTSDPERVLAGIWQDLLGIAEVGVDDNFFDLGGDSLLLLRVQVKIRQATGADLSSAEMFQHPTIGSLARRIAQPAEEEPTTLSAVQDRAQLQRAALARRQQPIRRS
jgi:acyl transferase domain-containing protein